MKKMNILPKLKRIATLATLLATVGCATTLGVHNPRSTIEKRVEYETIQNTSNSQNNNLELRLENSDAGTKPELNDTIPLEDKDYGNILFNYSTSLPLVPNVAIHEGAHALPMLLMGVGVEKISILPERDYSKLQAPLWDGYVRTSRPMTRTENIIATISPYLVDLFGEHRLLEQAYKKHNLGDGLFPLLANGLITSYFLTDNVGVVASTINDKGDIASLSESLGVNKWVVMSGLGAAYLYSTSRIIGNMDKNEMMYSLPSTWLLYGTLAASGKLIGEFIDLIKK
jgi:hypothetical protein